MGKGRRSAHFVDKEELLRLILDSKRLRRVTPGLAKLFNLMAERYTEHPYWIGYPQNWRDDFASVAKVALCRGALKFDPTWAERRGKAPNAFAYCTQIMYNAVKEYRNVERGQERRRDELVPDPVLLEEHWADYDAG